MSVKVVRVGSHIAEIGFGGTKIPLGFLTSFRKKNHSCGGNHGFLVRKSPSGDVVNVVCPCVVPRAHKRLKQVGQKAFEALGVTWLEEEKIKIKVDEEKCRKEGYEAARDDACPYPEKTDQFLAWVEGHQQREEEIQAADAATAATT